MSEQLCPVCKRPVGCVDADLGVHGECAEVALVEFERQGPRAVFGVDVEPRRE